MSCTDGSDPRERGKFQYWLEVEHSPMGWSRARVTSDGYRGATHGRWLCRVRWPRAMGCIGVGGDAMTAIYRALRMQRAWRNRHIRREWGPLFERSAA